MNLSEIVKAGINLIQKVSKELNSNEIFEILDGEKYQVNCKFDKE